MSLLASQVGETKTRGGMERSRHPTRAGFYNSSVLVYRVQSWKVYFLLSIFSVYQKHIFTAGSSSASGFHWKEAESAYYCLYMCILSELQKGQKQELTRAFLSVVVCDMDLQSYQNPPSLVCVHIKQIEKVFFYSGVE